MRLAFNGGPDNRPARPGQADGSVLVVERPSMEGRTIVRPDYRQGLRLIYQTKPFNGGPDNRPARHSGVTLQVRVRHYLQWRAGQSSGQTGGFLSGCGRFAHPSMEGRTIVRPDSQATAGLRGLDALQWRAGQSSGQTAGNTLGCLSQPTLQWRAGQSSGQTNPDGSPTGSVSILQWRAGQSSGQTLLPVPLTEDAPLLQWRAGQSSGQTGDRGPVVSADRCPSMEGRTIVRPDHQTTKEL